MERKFLEDIVVEEKDKLEKKEKLILRKNTLNITDVFDKLSDHPVFFGTAGLVLLRYYSSDLAKLYKIKEHSFDKDLVISYLTYLGLKGIGRILGKNNLEYKLSNLIINNPSTTSLSMMTLMITYGIIESDKYPVNSMIDYYKVFIPILGLSTELLINGIKTSRKIKNSNKNIKRNIFEKSWNFIFEHPAEISIPLVLYNLVDVYNYRVSHNTFTGNILDDFSKDPLWPIMTFGIIGGFG